MTWEGLMAEAVAIAEEAHRDQVDKAGKPYIGHPKRVMERFEDPAARIVGVLHDVVEDSDVTLDDLRSKGFPANVIAAVDALTKRDGEPYEAYLERLKGSALALRVKIADMQDNMDLSRIAHPTDRDRARLEKYRRRLPELEAALAVLE
jgi:(p)ppGpp synthase/HD superfamily hydrolase